MDSTSTTLLSYEAAVQWVYDRINYERTRPRKANGHFRLDRIHSLLQLVGNPQNEIPAVHIAGTKGKGSTTAFLSSILTESGLRTGMFTSPHLQKFEERMQVDGEMPTPQELTALVSELKQRLASQPRDFDGPTYFEVATVLAWMYFRQRNADIVVLETGLGGRLDCTNVCRPLASLITAIGLDHTHILGDTIEAIAAEKAGIIKPGVPVISWTNVDAADRVVAKTAEATKSRLYRGGHDFQIESRLSSTASQVISVRTPWRLHDELQVPLAGVHQARNAAMAVCAADLLSLRYSQINATSIQRGLSNTRWPLRFQLISGRPDVLLDAAHNPDAVSALIDTIRETQLGADRQRVLVFASSRDKDAASMLKLLAPEFDAIVLTRFLGNPRTYTPEQLADMIDCASTEVYLTEDPQRAVELAANVAGEAGLVCATGSIFLVAELNELLAGSAEQSDADTSS